MPNPTLESLIENLKNINAQPISKEGAVYNILKITADVNNRKNILANNKNLIPALINLLKQKEATLLAKKHAADIIINLTMTADNRHMILNDNPNFGKILNDFVERTDVSDIGKELALNLIANFIPTLIYLLAQNDVTADIKEQAARAIANFTSSQTNSRSQEIIDYNFHLIPTLIYLVEKDNVTAATKEQALRVIQNLIMGIDIISIDNRTKILKSYKTIITTLMNYFIKTNSAATFKEKALNIIRKLTFSAPNHRAILVHNPDLIPTLIDFLEQDNVARINKQFAMDVMTKFAPILIERLRRDKTITITEKNATRAMVLFVVNSNNSEKILELNPNLISTLIDLLARKKISMLMTDILRMLEKFATDPKTQEKLNANGSGQIIISVLENLLLQADITEQSKKYALATINGLKHHSGTENTVINSNSYKRLSDSEIQNNNQAVDKKSKKAKYEKFTNYDITSFKR